METPEERLMRVVPKPWNHDDIGSGWCIGRNSTHYLSMAKVAVIVRVGLKELLQTEDDDRLRRNFLVHKRSSIQSAIAMLLQEASDSGISAERLSADALAEVVPAGVDAQHAE